MPFAGAFKLYVLATEGFGWRLGPGQAPDVAQTHTRMPFAFGYYSVLQKFSGTNSGHENSAISNTFPKLWIDGIRACEKNSMRGTRRFASPGSCSLFGLRKPGETVFGALRRGVVLG
jgi:hypothetical protein